MNYRMKVQCKMDTETILDCAGRAQRRRRFRTEGRAGVVENFRTSESGVALRLPPQSKTSQKFPPALKNLTVVLSELF